jgi:hypothetical protein
VGKGIHRRKRLNLIPMFYNPSILDTPEILNGGTEKRTRARREDKVTLRHDKLQDERGAAARSVIVDDD